MQKVVFYKISIIDISRNISKYGYIREVIKII